MDDFIKQINLKNQHFKCYESLDTEEKLSFTVGIHNLLKDGASEKQINQLKKIIPENNEEIIELYRLHNGITLYRNTEADKKYYPNGDCSGICFYPINELKRHNKEWKSYLIQMLDSEDQFDFQKYGVTFGEVSYSMNSFVLFNGKVYYDNHDDKDDTPVGETVKEFLSKIAADPAKFLEERGGYTRYSDNKTDRQWIPKEFFADEN